MNVFFLLGRSSVGRGGLREQGVYEVLRVSHLLEKANELKTIIEEMVHLIVYSEEELAEQDKQRHQDSNTSADR